MKKILTGIICMLLVCSTCVFAKSSNTTNNTTNNTTEETTEVTTTEGKEKINVYIFTKDGCPHCQEAEEFLETLSSDATYGAMFNTVNIQVYDSSWNVDEDNESIMNAVADYFGDDVQGVPYIIVGNTVHLNGYTSDYDEEIKAGIKATYEATDSFDVLNKLGITIGEKVEKQDTLAVIIIFAVVLGGLAAFVVYSRKK